jgi:hypothetical protein
LAPVLRLRGAVRRAVAAFIALLRDARAFPVRVIVEQAGFAPIPQHAAPRGRRFVGQKIAFGFHRAESDDAPLRIDERLAPEGVLFAGGFRDAGAGGILFHLVDGKNAEFLGERIGDADAADQRDRGRNDAKRRHAVLS